jgi:SAM-dependent methyltransferase
MSEDTFDRIAAEYDEALPAHVVAHYLDKRTDLIARSGPPGRGLDVGCGTGVLAARLAERGYEMTGLDPSAGMLEVMAAEHPEVEAVRGSGDALPFADDSFDLVVTVAALHHIAAPAAVRATLAEMVRVCRPGGRVVVWDHNPRNPYWSLLMARVPQDDGSERLVPEDEVLDGIRAGGGLALHSTPLGFVPDFVPPGLLPVAAAAERLVERTPLARRLCAHNVVIATPLVGTGEEESA